MSDDTTTSTSTSGQDPVYTTSLTSTIGRPPRKLYFYIQLFVLLGTLGICFVHRNFQERFDSMDIKDLSKITKLVFSLGTVLTNPIGLACAIFLVVGLGLLAIRGALDGILKFLIWLNVLWLIVFLAVSTAGIWMPIFKAKQAAGH